MGFSTNTERSERQRILEGFREIFKSLLKELTPQICEKLELKYLWANMSIGQPREVLDIGERYKYGYLSAQMELQLIEALPIETYTSVISLEDQIAHYFRSTDYERDPDPYSQSRTHMNFFLYNETKKYRVLDIGRGTEEESKISDHIEIPLE